MNSVEMLRTMMLIRAFEEALVARRDHGFQLLSSGEEGVAVGICAALTDGDQLLSSGRSIGPALARGLDPGLVMAELLGKSAGPCGGKGGRGHLAQPAAGFFGAHAVVGGNISIAAGVALALQQQGRAAIAACVFGDGACGSGVLSETLNIAAIWKLPLLFVCDNNQYSVSTARSEILSPRQLSDLAGPFGIPGMTVDGMDALAVSDAALKFADYARSGNGPSFLECISYRFATHSTATRETRSPAEIALHKDRCPILRLSARLEAEGIFDRAAGDRLQREVDQEVRLAARFADASHYPEPSDVLNDVV